MKQIAMYVATLIPLVLFDLIWLTGIAKNFYASHMGFLFSKTVNLIPVIIFYPLYAAVILMLAVLPSISTGSWTTALLRGALLGLASYGAYDLTNQATITGWPVIVTIVDLLWGIAVTALVSISAYTIITHIKW